METGTNNWKVDLCKNKKQLLYWTVAWAITLVATTFGSKFMWDANVVISLLAIILNTVIGICMILAYKKHVDGLDELQRKLQLDAMAMSLGSGIVGGMGYSMLASTNVISGNAEISHIVVVMYFTYIIGVLIANARYK